MSVGTPPMDTLSRLMDLVEPYIHPAASHVRMGITGSGLVAFVRLQLKPSGRLPQTTPAAARLALFQRAQEVISVVERDGWRHVEHPEVTVSGQMAGPDGDRLVAEGWLVLKVAAPR